MQFHTSDEQYFESWTDENLEKYNWKIVNKDDFLYYFTTFQNNVPSFVLFDIYDYLYVMESNSNHFLEQQFHHIMNSRYQNIYEDEEYKKIEQKILIFQSSFQQTLYEYLCELYCLHPFFKEYYFEEYDEYDEISHINRYECNDKIDYIIYQKYKDELYYIRMYLRVCPEYTVIEINKIEDIEKIKSLITEEDVKNIYETFHKEFGMNRFILIFKRYIFDLLIKQKIFIYINSYTIYDKIYEYIYISYHKK